MGPRRSKRYDICGKYVSLQGAICRHRMGEMRRDVCPEMGCLARNHRKTITVFIFPVFTPEKVESRENGRYVTFAYLDPPPPRFPLAVFPC